MTAGDLPVGSLSGSPARLRRERLVRWTLQVAAALSIVVSVLIVVSLFESALRFVLSLDSLSSLWAAEGWQPRDLNFDLRTLFVASLIISGISVVVSAPLGIGAAVYLSEYANPRARRIVKPILEVLAGVPSVVLGFFALTFITPNVVRTVFPSANQFNMLSAGIAVGVLTSPLMASIAEDALRAVPHSLREASFGLGARKLATTLKVVLPAAISGIVAALIITVSRAIGETMVVTIAALGSGSSPFEANPLEPGLTMTSAIANLALGSDAPVVGDRFASLYFVGLLLFLVTLGLNLLGDRVVRKYRRAY